MEDIKRRVENLEIRDKDQDTNHREQVRECSSLFREIEERLSQGAKTMAITKTEMTAFRDWQERQNGSLQDIQATMKVICDRLGGLELSIVVGRPSWAVAAIIGTALAIIGGFIGRLF